MGIVIPMLGLYLLSSLKLRARPWKWRQPFFQQTMKNQPASSNDTAGEAELVLFPSSTGLQLIKCVSAGSNLFKPTIKSLLVSILALMKCILICFKLSSYFIWETTKQRSTQFMINFIYEMLTFSS